jgi:Tol biopolymer transport system component
MQLVVSNREDNSSKILTPADVTISLNFGHSCFDFSGENVVTTLLEKSINRLYIIPVSGGAPVRITDEEVEDEWYPVYSPLGTRLMYTRLRYTADRKDYTTQVYIFDTATGKTAPLVPDATQSTWCGCWSPDGRKVCYVVETEAGSKLYVKNVQPEDSQQLGVAAEKPAGFALKGVYPNPFNPSTTITFSLNETGHTTLNIFNVAGQKVDTLLNGVLRAGEHAATWNASGRASGIYFCRLEAVGRSEVRKMILAR